MRVLRAVYGTLLLIAPSTALRCVGSNTTARTALVTVRILGARQLGQALIDGGESPVGAAVDGLHAASMAILAVCAPGARRPAAASAVISCALAAHAMLGEGVSRRSARARCA